MTETPGANPPRLVRHAGQGLNMPSADPAMPTAAGFVEAILAAAGDRRQVEAVLRQWAGERVYLPRGPLRRGEPADLARRLVFGGVGRQAAQEMVQQRCLVSARHARRLVRAAVAIRGQTVSAAAPKMSP